MGRHRMYGYRGLRRAPGVRPAALLWWGFLSLLAGGAGVGLVLLLSSW